MATADYEVEEEEEEEKEEELEPLFDYSRIQPVDFIPLDGGSPDSCYALGPKRKRDAGAISLVENKTESCEIVKIDDDEEKEEDWLPPPPKKPTNLAAINGGSTLQELRLKKQELTSLAKSAEVVLRQVEEAAKREVNISAGPAFEAAQQECEPPEKRQKIIISIQDKDGLKQFRMYMDDKFERLFRMYAEKIKASLDRLVFSFDGDKISPLASPMDLGMENEDIIEVHQK